MVTYNQIPGRLPLSHESRALKVSEDILCSSHMNLYRERASFTLTFCIAFYCLKRKHTKNRTCFFHAVFQAFFPLKIMCIAICVFDAFFSWCVYYHHKSCARSHDMQCRKMPQTTHKKNAHIHMRFFSAEKCHKLPDKIIYSMLRLEKKLPLTLLHMFYSSKST